MSNITEPAENMRKDREEDKRRGCNPTNSPRREDEVVTYKQPEDDKAVEEIEQTSEEEKI